MNHHVLFIQYFRVQANPYNMIPEMGFEAFRSSTCYKIAGVGENGFLQNDIQKNNFMGEISTGTPSPYMEWQPHLAPLPFIDSKWAIQRCGRKKNISMAMAPSFYGPTHDVSAATWRAVSTLGVCGLQWEALDKPKLTEPTFVMCTGSCWPSGFLGKHFLDIKVCFTTQWSRSSKRSCLGSAWMA